MHELPPVLLACQGVLLSVPETMEDLRSMKKLWVHEILRVFYDRLVDGEDRKWLLDRISTSCTKHLNEDFNQLMGELDQNGDGEVCEVSLDGDGEVCEVSLDGDGEMCEVSLDGYGEVCEGYNELNIKYFL